MKKAPPCLRINQRKLLVLKGNMNQRKILVLKGNMNQGRQESSYLSHLLLYLATFTFNFFL